MSHWQRQLRTRLNRSASAFRPPPACQLAPLLPASGSVHAQASQQPAAASKESVNAGTTFLTSFSISGKVKGRVQFEGKGTGPCRLPQAV